MLTQLNRRQLVLAACASWVALPPSLLYAQARKASQAFTLASWKTSNQSLAPLALQGSRVLFAGDETLGAIDLHKTKSAPWQVAHNFSQGSPFRPRPVGTTQMLVAGRDELGLWRVGAAQALWKIGAQLQIGAPTVHGNRIYFGDGHELVALSAESGKTNWRFPTTPDTICAYAPVQHNDTVFCGPGDGRLYAVNAATGKLLWAIDHSDEWQYLRQLQIKGDLLIAGSYKEILYGISVHDGKVLWKFNAGNFINSQLVHGNAAFLWSPTGWVYAIDLASGRVLWRHQTTDYQHRESNWAPVMAELTAYQNKLFVLDMANRMHVLDVNSGKEVAAFTSERPLRPTALAIDQQRVVLATQEGEVLFMRLPSR